MKKKSIKPSMLWMKWPPCHVSIHRARLVFSPKLCSSESSAQLQQCGFNDRVQVFLTMMYSLLQQVKKQLVFLPQKDEVTSSAKAISSRLVCTPSCSTPSSLRPAPHLPLSFLLLILLHFPQGRMCLICSRQTLAARKSL